MKIFKFSRFEQVQANEFFRIPARVIWFENLVTEIMNAWKILRQGLRIDLGDIIFLLFFPIRFALAFLFSGVFHKYVGKKFFEKYGDDDELTMRHMSFYTLDWKRYLSTRPRAWDEY